MNFVISGASSGIGYHTVLELLKAKGNRVYALSRNTEKLGRLELDAGKISLGSDLIVIAGDLCNQEDRKRIISTIENEVRHIDVLVNNAGLLINKKFEEMTALDWEMIYATNVFATASLIRELLGLLGRAPEKEGIYRAHIVNIGSIGGLDGTRKFSGLSAYSSSKAAIAVMTECLAEEFKNRKIAVNGLALGSVQTEMFAKAFPGFKAAQTSEAMATYIADFAQNGARFFNGKNLPVSNSTP
jgi:NAD(P)-dependent dehydrogenase (short-subunit alcohol dehydrogenase family)